MTTWSYIPEFYLALGARPRRDDVDVALAVGQTSFLVPGCSAAADQLLSVYDPHHILSVVLDSHVLDPARPSLEYYAERVAEWHQHPGKFSFAISYDHIGDPERSARDHDRLCRRLAWLGVDSTFDPVVPVIQRGGSLGDVLGGPPELDEEEEVPLDELLLPPHRTPIVAVGGLAFAQYGHMAMSWLVTQLMALGRRVPPGGAHLLGLARPDVVRREGVVSFDSARPARQAAAGWQAIRPGYQARYGFEPRDLVESRAARLAYWIVDTRDRLGLPWRPVSVLDLPDDRVPPLPRRHRRL